MHRAACAAANEGMKRHHILRVTAILSGPPTPHFLRNPTQQDSQMLPALQTDQEERRKKLQLNFKPQ